MHCSPATKPDSCAKKSANDKNSSSSKKKKKGQSNGSSGMFMQSICLLLLTTCIVRIIHLCCHICLLKNNISGRTFRVGVGSCMKDLIAKGSGGGGDAGGDGEPPNDRPSNYKRSGRLISYEL